LGRSVPFLSVSCTGWSYKGVCCLCVGKSLRVGAFSK
jgi:hypothetical protein